MLGVPASRAKILGIIGFPLVGHRIGPIAEDGHEASFLDSDSPVVPPTGGPGIGYTASALLIPCAANILETRTVLCTSPFTTQIAIHTME